MSDISFLTHLEELLQSRKETLPEGSYTSSLFRGGDDKILKKIGEEAGEVIIAAKNSDSAELTHESADLLFHLLLLLVHKGLPLEAVIAELQKRHGR